MSTLTYVLTKMFFRYKTMGTKSCNNHQIRILTLEDNQFQDETLYRLKKGITYILLDYLLLSSF